MVFPLYDDNPFKHARLPYVTWGLIGINVVVFLILLTLRDSELSAAFLRYGATPAAVTASVQNHAIAWADITLVTGMFLHGGWGHIFGNMVYLWVFGDDIEDALGSFRFGIFYLLAGVMASAVHIAVNPSSTAPLIGASGAISGVLGAYLLLRPCAEVSVFVVRVVVRVRAFWVVLGWVLLQLYLLANNPDPGVAYLAHLGGVAAGIVLFLLLRPAAVQLFECIGAPGPER